MNGGKNITTRSVPSRFKDEEKSTDTKLVGTPTSLKHDSKKSMVKATSGEN